MSKGEKQLPVPFTIDMSNGEIATITTITTGSLLTGASARPELEHVEGQVKLAEGTSAVEVCSNCDDVSVCNGHVEAGEEEEPEEEEDEVVVDFQSSNLDSERKMNWLSLEKQAAESRCRELENELAGVRETAAKQDTSLRVAQEKIRHLEAESKGLLAAAEFRENEASTLQMGTQEAQERAQAHEKALANALEQLSDSSMSQSKKLEELAEVSTELKRTKAALERAERIVFDQRQEADKKLYEENRRRAEADSLRDKLSQAERENTELITKQAAGRLAKKVRGNFGRSSTFCASFCNCFRGRPTYRRVTSAGGLPTPVNGTPTLPVDSPWLG